MRNRIAMLIAALTISGCVSQRQPQPTAAATTAAAHNDGSTCQEERVTGTNIDRWICRDNRVTRDDHDQMVRDLQMHNEPLMAR
jgi:hypothetical protein